MRGFVALNGILLPIHDFLDVDYAKRHAWGSICSTLAVFRNHFGSSA